jgi:hypothetical protein
MGVAHASTDLRTPSASSSSRSRSSSIWSAVSVKSLPTRSPLAFFEVGFIGWIVRVGFAFYLDVSFDGSALGVEKPKFIWPSLVRISVLAGSSNGLRHQLTKAKTSIGRTGGGADIEIDDPQVSPLHCVVGVANDIVRLCDLDSVSGTYANGERVQAAELEHLSEFRLGSTWLVVTIVPKHFMDSTSF